jgi:lipopolysaccharide export system protein LptA
MFIMKKIIIFTLIFYFSMPGLLSVSRSFASEQVSADSPITCDGDKVEYFEHEKKIIGSGDVVITYNDMKLTCDKVTIWAEEYKALAEGNATLTQEDNVFSGELIEYDFKNNTGKVLDFSGYAKMWYVKGKQAEQVSEDEFIVRKSYITTCDPKDYKTPHWKISADRIDVYPNRMINSYNTVMWINPLAKEGFNIPLMWIPYYCHPLDDNRPRVTLIPGKSSDWGYYLLSAWRYHLSPNQKGYVHIDYREKKDLAIGVDYIYDTKMVGKGNLFGYSINEHGMKNNYLLNKWFNTGKDYSEYKADSEKYVLRARHQWEVNPSTLVTAELHKYDDKEVLKDYFFNDYEKDEHPLSYILATHTMPLGTMSFLTQKRVNDFDQVTELLPEAKLNIHNQRIGESRFYYKGDFKATSMNKVYPKDVDDPIDSQHANILDSYGQLSYQTKIGPVSATPYIGARKTFLDREVDRSKSIVNLAAYTGIDLSTRIHKVYDTHTSFMGIELNKLRHLITPTFGYAWISKPTKDKARMLSDGIDKKSLISLGLENKLQTKRGGDEGSVVDLARLLVSTTYDFEYASGSSFGDITGRLELRPYSWLTATSDAIFDSPQRSDYKWLKQINNNMYFNFGEKGSLGIGHSYQAGANNLIAQLKLDVLPGWRFSAYHDFDFLATRNNEKRSMKFKEQEYVITKDLHCWEVDLRYNIAEENGHEVMLIFRLKAFPDLPFEFGKTYNRPKAGPQQS